MNPLSAGLRDALAREFPLEVLNLLRTQKITIDNLRNLSSSTLARLLEVSDPASATELVLALDPQDCQQVLSRSSTSSLIHVLGWMKDEQREQFLLTLPETFRNELKKIRLFPANMAGHYMETMTGAYHPGDTVAATLAQLKAARLNRVRSVYLTDDQNRLAGRVDMQDMALADSDVLLSELCNAVEGTGQLTTSRDELVEIFNRCRVDSIPILDDGERLTGVVTYGALFKAARESLTDDIQLMVGASPEEKTLSSPWFAVRKRLPWLHINLLTAFLAASVVGLFESTIARFTALAVLLPVVAGQSGNAGSQALAVTIRGLALREISLLQWRQLLLKEIQVGLLNGAALAVTGGLGVYVWSQSPGLAAVVAIAMIISLIAAGLAGALVPMILTRLGQDPATASSIILTTVTDVVGFVSFLGTAALLTPFL